MSHNTRTQTDGTWTTGNYVTLVADWTSLDAKVFAAVNGDLGGTWAPSSPIVLNGTLGVSAINFGPTVIDYGGSVAVGASATVLVSGVSGGWPTFVAGHVKRTRTILHSWIERQATPLYHWVNSTTTGGVQSLACTIQSTRVAITYANLNFAQPIFTRSVIVQQPRMLLPLRVHDGARLASATITFAVPTARASAPVAAPRLRIFRADLSGNLTPLASVSGGADTLGFRAIASPTNGDAWFAGGATQSFTYACDQNNVIDVSQYLYYAELIEEVGATKAIPASSCDGTLVRERKVDVDLATTTNITIGTAPTIDGSASTNTVVLVKDQTDPTQNGVYLINGAGAWTRYPGVNTQADFTPGFLVRVKGGTVNATSIWECVAPTSATAMTLTSDGSGGTGPAITFQRRQPRGNVYFGLAVNHDTIATMQWQ